MVASTEQDYIIPSAIVPIGASKIFLIFGYHNYNTNQNHQF